MLNLEWDISYNNNFYKVFMRCSITELSQLLISGTCVKLRIKWWYFCFSFPDRFMIPEDGESTTNVTQSDIVQAADITTAQKVSTSQMSNIYMYYTFAKQSNKIQFSLRLKSWFRLKKKDFYQVNIKILWKKINFQDVFFVLFYLWF